MATITYVLNAVNRMSSPFNDAAGACDRLAAAEARLDTVTENLAKAELALAAAEKAAGSGAQDAANDMAAATAKVKAYGAAVNMAMGQVAKAETVAGPVLELKDAMDAAAESFTRFNQFRDIADTAEQTKTAILAEAAATRISTYADYQKVKSAAAVTKALLGQTEAVLDFHGTAVGVPGDGGDLAPLSSRLITVRDTLSSLSGRVTTQGALASLLRLQAAAERLQVRLANEKVEITGTGSAMAQLLDLEAGVARLQSRLEDVSDGGGGGGGAGRAAAGGFFGGVFGRFGFAGNRVPLFGLGGTAGTITALHLLIDLTAEFLAVAIPATIATVAFGAAAAPTVQNISRLWTNLNTVIDATGKNIPPVTGAFDKVAQAVQPHVYVLLGAALSVMNSRAGEFQKLAVGAGQAFDNLAARAQNAIESAGFSQFLKNAKGDLQNLGTLVGNIFGIFGNLLKALPGYATKILQVLDNVTHALEDITGSKPVQAIAHMGLAFHGLYIYAGLAALGIMKLADPFARVAVWAAGMEKTATATGHLAADASRLDKFKASLQDISMVASGTQLKMVKGADGISKLGTASRDTSGLLGKLGAAASFLFATPAGWIVLGTAAVAGLTYAWAQHNKTAKSALDAFNFLGRAVVSFFDSVTGPTKNWTTALQDNINKQTTFAGVVRAQKQAITATGASAKDAGNNFNSSAYAVTHFGNSLQSIAGQQAKYKATQDQSRSSQHNFSGELSMTQSRLDFLRKTFGSVGEAQAIFNKLGLKSSDISNRLGSVWHNDTTQAADFFHAMQMVARAGGDFNNNLLLLNKQTKDNYTAIQNLNSAWDAQIQAVTGARNSFDTYITGLNTIRTDAGRAHATMDGLNARSITLSEAFATNVNNTNSMIDTWRSAGIEGNKFNKAVKDSIAPMVQYAEHSKTARAELVALAQEADYRGPDSLKALTRWLGNTSNATQFLQKVSLQATQQELLLTKAFRGQGQQIAQQLIGQLNQAEIKTSGLSQDMTKLGNAIATQGRQSDAAHDARQRVINDLNKLHVNGVLSWQAMVTLGQKLTGLPRQKVITLIEHGRGDFTIQGLSASAKRALTSANLAKTSGFAGGGYVTAGSGPTADDVPIWASRGEYVMKAAAVAKYGTHLMNMMNAQKLAAGGPVQTGDTNVLSGQSASAFSAGNQIGDTGTMATVMTAAMNAAMAAAQSALGNVSGMGVAPNGPVQQYARKLLAAYGWASQWPEFNDIVMRECMPLDTEILTRRGWLRHDQVRAGDETLGYNPETGRNEWTKITAVRHYDDAPVLRVGNEHWEVRATPEHRWWSDTRFLSPGPRARHYGGKRRQPTWRERPEFVVTSDLGSRLRGRARIRTAAPADTDGVAGLSLDEVAILAWLQTDGNIRELANGGYQGRIYQSKPQHVVTIRALLASLPHSETIYPPKKPHHLPRHVFWLPRGVVTGIVKRSGLKDDGPEALVLSLSPDQRAVWLATVFAAEGNTSNGARRIAQIDGPMCDAIALAVYLEGYRPSVRAHRSDERRGFKPSSEVGLIPPHVTTQRFREPIDEGQQRVWCPTTELGTWTYRQDRRIGLTGNSGWNTYATNKSSGAYGIPQALPASKMASAGADWRTDPYTQLRWMMGYIKSVYGSPAAAWRSELTRGFYDQGGWLPPGASVAVNNTGRYERVSPPGGQRIVLEVSTGPGPSALDRAIVEIIKKHVRVAGGSDVQAALGG